MSDGRPCAHDWEMTVERSGRVNMDGGEGR